MASDEQEKALPPGWRRAVLGELGRLSTSSVDKRVAEDEQAVRLVNYMDVYRATHLRGNIDLMEVTASLDEISRFRVHVGDILFTPSSETPDDIGHSAVVTEDLGEALHSYHTVRLRPDGQIPLDLDFRGWVANAPEVLRYFATRATGSTRFTLSLSDFREAPALIPPLPEQRKIAAILGSVDVAIRATRGVIEQTRTVKQGLLQELLTRGIGHTRFKQTEIGEVPEGWEVVRFKDVSTVVRGGSPRPAGDPRYFDGDHIPWITVRELTRDEFVYLRSTETCLTEEGSKRSRRLEAGTLVLSNSGATLGVPKVLTFAGCANDGVAAFLNLSDQTRPLFLYYYLFSRTSWFRDVVAPGLGQPNLNTTLIGETLLPLPRVAEQEEIASVLQAVDAALEEHLGLVISFQDLKEGLMQDLLTGRVRVKPDA